MGKSLNYRVRRLFNDRPNPTFVPKPWHKIINWGSSQLEQDIYFKANGVTVINNPVTVSTAANKLSTFNLLKDKDGINIPTFTTDRSVAALWCSKGSIVVCRTKLSGHSGDGIVLANKPEDLVQAPLYVRYIKKEKEFRIHVAFGEVIDVQEKRQRKDYEGKPDFQIRNHQTGWVYCREDIQEPREIRDMAVRSVLQLGLDFGAVDLLYNTKQDRCYVLEVNTAPGLEGSTVEKYAKAFVTELTK